ncbi:ferritin-like superfamily, partial [Jimgerdemannia flammicorona]
QGHVYFAISGYQTFYSSEAGTPKNICNKQTNKPIKHLPFPRIPKPRPNALTHNNMSLAKQNYSNASEEAVNQQINTELQASLVYLSMAAWAGSVNVALPGLEKYFRESCEEERAHAQLLINYQNMRGGRVVLRALQAPELDWGSAKNAVESSLQLEKDVNKSLLNLHKIAEESNDPQLCDYIESNFLEEQVKSIKALASMCTQLNRVGDGLGVYLWDQQLRNSDTGVETGDITA